jgi:molybdopterin converting factor small subunit
MPTLRLFANLREAAGTSSVDIDGSTVGDVLAVAITEYGSGFEAGLGTARVWVNGEPADDATVVGADDEIALIPPVSGGALATPTTASPTDAVYSLAIVGALLIAAYVSLEWFVFVAVGAVLAWLWDLSETAEARPTTFNIYATVAAPVAAATGAYAWGFSGFAGGIALGIMISLVWPVFDTTSRDVRLTAVSTTVAIVAGLAAGGLVLLRHISTDAVAAFVIVVAAGVLISWLAQVYGAQVQSLDPNVGALLGSLAGGVVVGLTLDSIDMAAALLGAVAVAAGIIGGRTLGSLIRTGQIFHTESAPGLLTPLDGVLLAAPLFWLALWIFG